MTNQSYIPSTSGLQSYVDASPAYELAPIGIASMQDQVQKLAEFGRNGDIYVIHAAQGETVIPMEVLEANPQIKALLFNQMAEMGLDPQRYVVGDQLNSLNPVTGMPEFFFSSIFKGIKKAIKSVVKVAKKLAPIVLPIAAAFFGVPFLSALSPAIFGAGQWGAMALANGIGSLIGGGSLKDAFKSAAIGGIGSLIGAGFKGAFSAGPGQRLAGFGAGVKSGFTGQIPIYNAAGAQVGTQVPATARQAWDAIVSGDPIGGITSAIKGELGTTTYTPEYMGQFMGDRGSPVGNILPEGLTKYVAPPSLAPVSELPVTSDIISSPDKFDFSAIGGEGGTQGDYFTRDLLEARPPLNVEDQFLINRNLPRPVLEEPLQSQFLVDRQNILKAAGVGEKAIEPVVKKTPYLGKWSPTQAIGEKVFGVAPGEVPTGAANIGDLALGGLGAYGLLKATGGLEEEPEEKVTLADIPSLGDPRLTRPEREALAEEQQLAEASLNPFLFAPQTSYTSLLAARGGSVNYPERDLLVEGPGTEKSDEIPAMLSDGEFVINSKAVRGADPSGRGNRYAGAQNLYNLMRNFEMRA